MTFLNVTILILGTTSKKLGIFGYILFSNSSANIVVFKTQ